MRFRVRKTAHLLERVGLAMAGAACGLFVGAYVGSAIPSLTTQGFLLLMMLLGVVGFYLGIDTPLDTLASAADSLRPDLVVVSAVSAERVAANAPELRDLARRHRVALGGAGAAGGAAEEVGAIALQGDLVAEAGRVTALVQSTRS